jgi:hypothetical protein
MRRKWKSFGFEKVIDLALFYTKFVGYRLRSDKQIIADAMMAAVVNTI